jgi:hypothetical protein
MMRAHANWQQILEAARRKVAIARLHLDHLQNALRETSETPSNVPPIPVQAYFEGVVISVIAAIDQVEAAVKSALPRPHELEDRKTSPFYRLGIPDLTAWYDASFGRDLRRIRVRMVHYIYAKTLQGPGWVVESAGRPWPGSRELFTYAQHAVEYGERLEGLLPQITAEITRRDSHISNHDEIRSA